MSKHSIPQALRDQFSAIEDDAASMGSGAQAIFTRMRTSVQAFYMEQPAGGAVKDEIAFEYRHANGERHTVTVSREQVIEQMPDFLFEALCDKFCKCEPIGETNVVECCCDEYAEEFRLLADAPHPVSGEQKARPTGLSRGWNLTRQVDGFVIGHSSEEPSEKSKAQALLDGRVYVPFLTAAAAPPAAQDVAGLVDALTDARQVLATALQASAPDWFKTEAHIAGHHTIKKIDGALAAHRAQLGEQS